MANCPIKLKVCHPLCYWYRKGRCIFPLGGYDKRGNPRGRKNLLAPKEVITNPAKGVKCLLDS